MLKTGVNSDLYFSDINDYKDGIKQAKKDGFDCLDMQLFGNINGELFKINENEFIKKLSDLKDFANGNGIEFYQIHLPYGLDETTEEKRLSTVKYYERSILGAKILGSTCAVFHSMYPFGWVDSDKQMTEGLNREFVNRILPFAQKNGVILCIENLPWHENVGIPKVKDLRKFVDGFNSPYLKFCLDTGHACLIKDDLYQDVLTFGKDLTALHIHENRQQRDDFHALPFTCDTHVDWNGFLKGLKQVGYNGVINLEINLPSKFTPVEIVAEYRRLAVKIAKYMAKQVK